MRDGFIGIAWLLFGLMPVTNALAQITVGPANRVNPNGTQWFECTVAGHLAFNGNRVVVAAIEHSVGGPFLNACYSTNGGVNWTTVSGLGPGATADPGLVLDRSSDTIWYSGIATALGQCSVRVAHKGASDSTFLGAYAATSGTDSCDKPLMAIGDGPNNGVLFYIFHADQDPDSNDPDDGHWYAYSANTDSPQVEQLWNHVRVEPQPLPPAQPPWNGPDYYGQGAMGVVLDSESAAPGRVVVIESRPLFRLQPGNPVRRVLR